MKEVIILAGGLGTRLRSAVEEQPKVLAPIAGKPFLEYLLDYLEDQWVDHVILALGYKGTQVTDWLKNKAYTFKISSSFEQEPLGTGGAIKRALIKCKSDDVMIMNGDTFFPIDLSSLWKYNSDGAITIALKRIKEGDRYGQVLLDQEGFITEFLEKQPGSQNVLINAGIYKVIPSKIQLDSLPNSFSWEEEVLSLLSHQRQIKGLEFYESFIDIGIPADYELAQTLIPSLIQ